MIATYDTAKAPDVDATVPGRAKKDFRSTVGLTGLGIFWRVGQEER